MVRRHLEKLLKRLARKYPIVTITGPRQSGKTTLTKMAFPEYTYVSLEDPDLREFALNDPRDFLAKYSNKVILDEVQRTPELFSYLQTDVDSNRRCGRFILTGSQDFVLSNRISQSLAGRTAILKLMPFSLAELNGRGINGLWWGKRLKKSEIPRTDLFRTIFTGFYPRIHDVRLEPDRWYREYFETYVSRDVRGILNIGDIMTFESFVRLLGGRSGQPVNLTSLGNDAGVSHTTARRWLSILEASYIIKTLPPYYKNFGKRQIKRPKIYFLDCGFLCSLLRIRKPEEIENNPLRGAIFETFVFSEIYKCFTNMGEEPPLYFWQGSGGIEIDLLIDSGTWLLPVEIKSGKTISQNFFKGIEKWRKIVKSEDPLGVLVYGGDEYQKRGNVEVIPWFGVS